MMKSTRSVSSSRQSMVRPMTTPNQMALRTSGCFQKRYAQSRTAATTSGSMVSAAPISTGIHMFGSSAIRRAAISPTRRPPISLPAKPATTMAAALSTHDHIRAA